MPTARWPPRSTRTALNVLFAILLIVTLLSSGAVWLEGADRTQAIASLDGAAPKWMGRFTSFGTPIAVNIMSGIVASALSSSSSWSPAAGWPASSR